MLKTKWDLVIPAPILHGSNIYPPGQVGGLQPASYDAEAASFVAPWHAGKHIIRPSPCDRCSARGDTHYC